MEPSFGHYTDTSDRLKWNPPSLATQLRKLLWLTSACFSRKFVQNRLVASLRNDRNGRGFTQKWAWLLKFCTRFARNSNPPTVPMSPDPSPRGDSGLGARLQKTSLAIPI
jgi:hypothetical protein